MNLDESIEVVRTAVIRGAQAARNDAGFSGSWGDGGAGQAEERLAYWLDGISFGRTGKTEKYGHIISKFEKENDPEYQEYLRLQKKFEEK